MGLFPDTIMQPSAILNCQNSLWRESGLFQLALSLSSSQAQPSSQKSPGPMPSREFVCGHLVLEVKMNRHGLFHTTWLQHSGMFPSSFDLLTSTWPKHLLYGCQIRIRELTLTEGLLTTIFTDTEFQWKRISVRCLRVPVAMSKVENFLHPFSPSTLAQLE